MTDLLWIILFAVSPACQQEDSANCAWNAGTSGNGVGTSFVDVNGTAYYPDGTWMDRNGDVWQPMSTAAEREIGHGPCEMNVGGTTYVVCADGYRTTS